jgi:hypothetical protein
MRKKLKQIPSIHPKAKRERWIIKNKPVYVSVIRVKGRLQTWQRWSAKKPLKSVVATKYTVPFKYKTRVVTTYPVKNAVCQMSCQWTFRHGRNKQVRTGFSNLYMPDSKQNIQKMLNQTKKHAWSQTYWALDDGDYSVPDDVSVEYHPHSIRYIVWRDK